LYKDAELVVFLLRKNLGIPTCMFVRMETPFDTSSSHLLPKDKASPSSEHSEISADSPLDAAEALYLRHEVSKLDTLPGLAIKYGVSVSDIKRVNSLMSDSAMFARSTLLIPTKQLPLGSDVAAWVGMIVSGYGRHAGLQSASRKHGKNHLGLMGFQPSSSAALTALTDFYGLEAGNGAAQRGGTPRGASRGEAPAGEVEVELMKLNSTEGFAGSHGGQKADDRLRRRGLRGPDSPPGDEADGSEAPPPPPRVCPQALDSVSQTELPAGGGPVRTGSGSSGAPLLARKESFLERLKRAASQPALAGPSRGNLATLADAVVGEGRRLTQGGPRPPKMPPKPTAVKASAKKD